MHYPDLFMKFGPLIGVWTLRFESKHKYFKYVIENSKNFINTSKLIATRHQMLQASLNNNRFSRTNIICSKFENGPNEGQQFATDLKLNNTRFRVGEFIVAHFDESNDKIQMVKIETMEIVQKFSEVIFTGKALTMAFDESDCLYKEMRFES
jgi:hypothetical protein